MLQYRHETQLYLGYGGTAHNPYLQTKFAASSVLPLPVYVATCGYGHSGRVRSTLPLVTRDATIRSGALPCSTHCSSAATVSNWLGPSPPPQCPMPGTMTRRCARA